MNKTIKVWDRESQSVRVMSEEAADSNSARFYKNPDVSLLEADALNGALDMSKYKLADNGAVVSKQPAELVSDRVAAFGPFKEDLVRQIDVLVAQKIATGSFEHPADSGNLFSITTTAQIKWIGLFNARDFMAYPMKVYTKDDSTEYSIADADEVAAIYGLAVGTVRALLDAATDAKTAILAAADEAEAQAAFEAYNPPE